MSERIPCPECGHMKFFEGLCWRCLQKAERIRYLAMTGEEVAREVEELVAHIVCLKGNRKLGDKALSTFWALLAYIDICTRELAAAAYEKGIYWPGALYRNAEPEVIQGLISKLKDPACREAGDIQCCLANHGGAEVLDCFRKLEANPLPWREKLYVDPSRYAHEGGWTFYPNASDVKIEPLVPAHCYSLEATGQEDCAVQVAQAREETCIHCGCQLVDILRLDGRDERLAFLGLPGSVHLPICPNCISIAEYALIRYTPDKDSEVELVAPEETPECYIDPVELEAMASSQLCLSREEVPAYFAHGGFPISTIGGMPNWEQDSEYKPCPDCGRTTRFLGQVVWEQLLDCAEGTLFLTYCPDCQLAIAQHQQT